MTDFRQCPVCKGGPVSIIDIGRECDEVTGLAQCDACDATWIVVYEPARITNVNGGGTLMSAWECVAVQVGVGLFPEFVCRACLKTDDERAAWDDPEVDTGPFNEDGECYPVYRRDIAPSARCHRCSQVLGVRHEV